MEGGGVQITTYGRTSDCNGVCVGTNSAPGLHKPLRLWNTQDTADVLTELFLTK